MKVLVIHPEDELERGPWAGLKWDRAIDLGRAGQQSYERASASFGCSVTRLSEFRENFQEMRRVRELLALGMGRLNDSFGLDWWELTAILIHQQLELAFLLQQFLGRLGPQDEVHVSRASFQADILRLALGSRLHTFPARDGQLKGGVQHYLRVLRKFPVSQLAEIFWDKTDSGYQIRGLFNTRPKSQSGPVVLVPSSYINVSRTGGAYAESLPDGRFLLVLTRRSGWLKNLPANMAVAWLRRYASVGGRSRKLELLDLLERWDLLRRELMDVPECRTVDELGWFDEFPERFARGLEIRDAWRNVFDSEPVQAVVCADDTNPYTHIPLLLARQKRLPAIACHHGALDGRYMFKRNHADVLLAKGKMEEDYLVRLCGISSDTVEIGAPVLSANLQQHNPRVERPHIVFFSEAYEVGGGRGRSVYQDVLPALADFAMSHQRELIVKLHPSESFTERSRMVEQILSPAQGSVVRVISGPLESEMLSRTWFGVTVMSTVAVECALQGIPCFICAWLEAWPYGYDDQFARFKVGIRLDEPSQIRQILQILRDFKISQTDQENWWRPIKNLRLQQLLGMARRVQSVTSTAVSRPAGNLQ